MIKDAAEVRRVGLERTIGLEETWMSGPSLSGLSVLSGGIIGLEHHSTQQLQTALLKAL